MNAAATRKAANGSKHSGGTVFINARLIDPSSDRDEPGGLLVLDGKIADLGPHLDRLVDPLLDDPLDLARAEAGAVVRQHEAAERLRRK